MSSNFNFYVNRQGVKGQRGAKGEQGFSPVISVESQTANEYILKVENEDGSFTTPNLRGNAIENNGGTYIRFNPETEQMYTGYADGATTEQAGVVRMGVYEDLVAGESEELVPNVADVHNYVQNSIGDISGFVTTSDFNTYTTTTDAALLSLSTNKLNTSTYDAYVLETASTLNGLSTNKQDTSTAVTHTASTAVGSGTQPIYIATDGTATPTTYSLSKSVPSDAVFTDTTYTTMIGASSSTGGSGGLVPAPSAGDNEKYLCGDGTWKTVSGGGGSSLSAGVGININSSNEIDIIQEDVPSIYSPPITWGVTTVGNPTNNNGVYSNFSQNNYLKFGAVPNTVSSFVISLDFNTGTLASTFTGLFGVETDYYVSPCMFLNASNKLSINFHTVTGTQWNVNFTTDALSSNTDYNVKIVYDGSSVSASIKTGNTTTDLGTISATDIVWTSDFLIGNFKPANYPDAYWKGAINLSTSYIAVNGSLLNMTASGQTDPLNVAKATNSLYGLVKPDGTTTEVNNGIISTLNTVQSTSINSIVSLTQAQYDALVSGGTIDANTMYIITTS